ncbi:MAG: group II intron maturase-specific domain-containing protein [Xenococcaceae cyanobacterium MO_167.B27]|nr:group II intron maturase-specific domain-containing protein [Xenococcaceae cyanobacterium MO_167.B27]
MVKSHNKNLGIIRYADDFIITSKTKEEMDKIVPRVKQWLSDRGLELSEEKTKLAHIDEGFNFLGFNVRQYGGKLLIKPQKEKVLSFCKKLGQIIKDNSSVKQEALIRKLNPVLRGFANYYQRVVSKETFTYITYRVWKYLWKWCLRRHRNKGKKWIANKYFRTIDGVKWQFCCETSNREGKTKFLRLYDIGKHPIIRHIKIRGTASPLDPELKSYWEERTRKLGKQFWAKGSKYSQVANNQKHKCPRCNQPLLNGENIETHHIVPVKDGGSNDIENLIHLHTACHKQEHSKTKFKAGSMA